MEPAERDASNVTKELTTRPVPHESSLRAEHRPQRRGAPRVPLDLQAPREGCTLQTQLRIRNKPLMHLLLLIETPAGALRSRSGSTQAGSRKGPGSGD